MIAQVRYLESSNFFENEGVPILIMDTEHHGRVGMHSHDFYEFVYIDKAFPCTSVKEKLLCLLRRFVCSKTRTGAFL